MSDNKKTEPPKQGEEIKTGEEHTVRMPDPEKLAHVMNAVAEKSQKLLRHYMDNMKDSETGLDPLNLSGAFAEFMTRMMIDPSKMIKAQMALWQDYIDLWDQTTRRMLGEEAHAVIQPDKGDKRFSDAEWEESTFFDYLKQSYLLTSRWMQTTVQGVEGLDDKTRKKIDFYTRQFADAISPTNFAMTNPKVLHATIESGGENLIKGLENLLRDIDENTGKLKISMTDKSMFKVGENLAVTPGKVIYQNDMMQLIQYSPSTETVYDKPLLICPPWINKYYILDLTAKNSFVKWAVAQGHTVFLISWVNPTVKHAKKTFTDYMDEGVLTAMDVVKEVTGKETMNMIGYCLGGTLLSATLAYLKAKKKDKQVNSATFFTTMIDFSDVGETSVFIDEGQLASLDKKMKKQGYLEAEALQSTFNMLRANDLIWTFVVNNYLLGKDPFPFDLLYWNSDSTRMPAEMHSFYLHNMYEQNNLIKKAVSNCTMLPLILPRLILLHTLFRPRKIILLRGRQHSTVPICSQVIRHLFWRLQVILPGLSILLKKSNIAIGPIRNWKKILKNGWQKPNRPKVHGGRTGMNGLPPDPVQKSNLRQSAEKNIKQSRMLPAHLLKSGLFKKIINSMEKTVEFHRLFCYNKISLSNV